VGGIVVIIGIPVGISPVVAHAHEREEAQAQVEVELIKAIVPIMLVPLPNQYDVGLLD
jgi:hypothetical protein